MVEDGEERKVRCLLLGGAVFCAATFVVIVLACTILLATQFNLLEWLE